MLDRFSAVHYKQSILSAYWMASEAFLPSYSVSLRPRTELWVRSRLCSFNVTPSGNASSLSARTILHGIGMVEDGKDCPRF